MAQDMDLFGDAFDTFDYNESNGIIAFPTDEYKYSPAPATIFSPAMAMSRTTSQSTNVETISPQELSLRDPIFSAPSSTAFPNLTSPSSFEESPFMDDSPMFAGDGLSQNDNWFPLFEQSALPTTEQASAQPMDASPYLHVEEIEASEQQLDIDEQRQVSNQIRDQRRSSSGSPGGRASQSAGVAASRRRNQPLPPIIVEDKNDTVAMKRARNTLAARKSRQKKMEKFEELEGLLAAMTEERDKWKAMALARNPSAQ